MENYDMEALYLYNDDWQYRVGKIEKINDKSIRMQFNTKIKKENFKSIHKLTDEEVKIFRKELIKKLSNTTERIRNTLASINRLNSALQSSNLVCVNSDNLQKKLNSLSEILSKELPKVIKIDNKDFILDDSYSNDLIEKK